MSARVLISGAGIAGPALAYWLHRFGQQPTLVECAPQPRKGGQAVDVRGIAIDVLAEMGLREAAYERRTHMRGVSVLDHDGKEVWRSEERSFSGGRFDSGDIEIHRDDLVRLLVDCTRDVAEYIWADSVTSVHQSTDGVNVRFERKAARTCDILVAADGLHSHVRRLVFGGESGYVKPFGIGFATFGCPNMLDLRDWQVSHREPTSGYLIFPNRDNSQLRVNLGFGLESADSWRGSIDDQKTLVARAFADYKWEMPRLLEAMWRSDDFYFGDIGQVKMAEWAVGRTVLLGDAGYCPSPMSGQGTSLALVGAFVLAREIARTPEESSAAFRRYQERMRPYVELNQALADPTREGPVPDDMMDRAKRGIVLDDLNDAPGEVARNWAR
jgi:2-polyprenyl-6-methoxyphenol hydroxylase-like FAD-dependent oxidoreductase